MSKKSRKRNRKILGALGALGLGLALANRGKGTEMSNISVDSGRGGDSASAKARAIANAVNTENTIQDNMPIVPKKTNVVKTGDVLGRMKGNVEAGGGFKGQEKRAAYAQKMRNLDADIKRNNMLRAIRSNVDIATTPDSIIEGVPLEDYMISAKKGGRIVKGKKTAVRKVGIAKRGFGRAMKRSK